MRATPLNVIYNDAIMLCTQKFCFSNKNVTSKCLCYEWLNR